MNNQLADQTPTPTTRLIRNCEEFGLFDDLKHVNPFEETFRQAIDGKSKSSNILLTTQKSLELVKCNDEETLHTPILCKYTAITDKRKPTTNDSHSYLIQSAFVKKKKMWPKTVNNSEQSRLITKPNKLRKIHPKPVIISTNRSNTMNPIKEKIRQSLLKFQTNQCDKKINGTIDSVSKTTPDILKVESKAKPNIIKTNNLKDTDTNERNREAAKRYRNKQRILHDKLLIRNSQLEAEIVQLRHQFEMFKKAHEKCSVTVWNGPKENS